MYVYLNYLSFSIIVDCSQLNVATTYNMFLVLIIYVLVRS